MPSKCGGKGEWLKLCSQKTGSCQHRRPAQSDFRPQGFCYGEYKTYQVPVAQIEELTQLDFGKLRENDPLSRLRGFPQAVTIGGPGDIVL
jgi:hypothetical protein